MAHITEVHIEGLLGRKEPIKLKFNRQVNVFFGDNGCGKTTLLKVLDAALSRDGALMERLPITKAIVDIFSINEDCVFRHVWERGTKTVRIGMPRNTDLFSGEYVETIDGRVLVHHDIADTNWRISSPKAKRKVPTSRFWSHSFLPTTRLYVNDFAPSRQSIVRQQVSESELDQAFSESVNKAWLQFYTKTLTEVRAIQEAGLRTVLKYVLSSGNDEFQSPPEDPTAIYTRVKNFLARQSRASDDINLGSLSAFKRRYETEENLRRIVDNLNYVERTIEKSMVPINNFLETIRNLLSRGKSLKLTNNELQVCLADDRVLPLSQLSSGEKHLIKILLTAMTSGPNSVLIDEPELSMHIDWQAVFVKTILSLNPDCQLILASHSPEVMAELPDECIFKL